MPVPKSNFSSALSQGVISVLTVSLLAMPPATSAQPTVEIDNNKIKLEVASTPAQIQRGLMYRTHMPEDQGMVFIFHPPQQVKFWMAHCFIPLDMLMVADGKIKRIFENVPPERNKPEKQCPTYPSISEEPELVTEVVEVNGGYAKRHGVKVGDSVKFSFADSSEKTPRDEHN
jgi:uncharacterized membrane protein (UPF0127 family)